MSRLAQFLSDDFKIDGQIVDYMTKTVQLEFNDFVNFWTLADFEKGVQNDIVMQVPGFQDTSRPASKVQIARLRAAWKAAQDQKEGKITAMPQTTAGAGVGNGWTSHEVTSAKSLHVPLLLGDLAAVKQQEQKEQQQPRLQQQQRSRRFGRWTCVHLSAPVPLWLFAAFLGWVTASAICMLLHLHSVAALRNENPFDFTLRLAVAADRCIGVGDIIGLNGGFKVELEQCMGTWDQQYLAKPDGTIRFKENNDLCLTMSSKLPSKQIIMRKCADGSSHEQAFDVLPNGRIALRAKRELCMNLLHGDVARGVLGMHECDNGFNEVFVYGGAHFLVPLLLHQWHQVQTLYEEVAKTLRLGIWVLPSCAVAGIVAFALSRRLLKASGTSHGCCLRSIHGLAMVCVAAGIFLQFTVVTCIAMVTWKAQQNLNGTNITTAATPRVDFTLRLGGKIGFCIGAADGLHDQAGVTLQHCHAGGQQQFVLQTDGTVRSKHRNDLCLTKAIGSSQWQLQTCSASSAGRQVFSAEAQSHGWLQLQAMPDKCMSLLGGDTAKGNLGVHACARDINEVFVYSGGNAGIAELALHLNDALMALTEALQVLDGFPVVALQRAAHAHAVQFQVWEQSLRNWLRHGPYNETSGHSHGASVADSRVGLPDRSRGYAAACALLVAVPSILLLLGKRPAPRQDDEHLAGCRGGKCELYCSQFPC